MIGREEIATRVQALDPEEIEIVVRNLPYDAMADECTRRRKEEHEMLFKAREVLKI